MSALLLLSSQRVTPHSNVESLITSAVKNDLSRTPRQALLATQNRAGSKWRGSSMVMRCVVPVDLPHVVHMLVRVLLVFRWIFAAHFVDVSGPRIFQSHGFRHREFGFLP